MINSMTGYGRRESVRNGTSIAVEIKSVNHRFCEITCRLPKGLGRLEDSLKHAIRQACERGRIELTVSVGGGARWQGLMLDWALAKRYYDLLRRLQRELQLEGTIDIGLVAGFRDMFASSDVPLDEKIVGPVILDLTAKALKDLTRMRRREGKALLHDLTTRLRTIKSRLDRIQQRAPSVVRDHVARMKARVHTLLGDIQLDETRLEQEVALFADRCDVTEELTRLKSHLAQFRTALTETKGIGRRLDFLLQEMGREVNTIGAKANDAEISLAVVDLKSELEKMREQVQNIE